MEPIQVFNSILKSFNIHASCVDYKRIENYFYFDVRLEASAKVRDLQKYSDEISLALKAQGKPRVKILHIEGVVRLEFLSTRTESLRFFDLISSNDVINGEVICLLGQSVDGKPIWMDLSKNPHMLVAGTTGSGKSTLLHNIIANIFTFNDISLFLMDPKNIEFSPYDNLMFNNVYVGYSYSDSIFMMNNLLSIMEYRYSLLRKGIDISSLPYVVVIIDEFADLILQDHDRQFYTKLCTLAQKCRAARISIILATQRPSVNVVDGTIKANFPVRIACKTASHVDSKVILDATGAENLAGKGDALLRDNTRFLERFQIAYTDAQEVCAAFSNS